MKNTRTRKAIGAALRTPYQTDFFEEAATVTFDSGPKVTRRIHIIETCLLAPARSFPYNEDSNTRK